MLFPLLGTSSVSVLSLLEFVNPENANDLYSNFFFKYVIYVTKTFELEQ